MAGQDNQNSTPKFIEFLRAEGNSRTVTSEETTQCQETTDINLELSLGSWYRENKTTSEGPSNVGVIRANPSSSEVVRAVRSVARNPTFIRAIRYIDSEIHKRKSFRSRVVEGVGSAQMARTSLPPLRLHSNTYQICLPIINQTPIPTYSISTVVQTSPDNTVTLGNPIPSSVTTFLAQLPQEGVERSVVPEVTTD